MMPIGVLQTIDYAQQKASLETEIGRRMYSVFNSPPVIGELRALVRVAVEQLAVLASRTTDGVANKVSLGRELFEIRATLMNELPLAVWRGRNPTPETLLRMAGESGTWSAADCSDLIRLFVSVIEHLSKASSGKWELPRGGKPKPFPGPLRGYEEVGNTLDQYRPGPSSIWDKNQDRARDGIQKLKNGRIPALTTGTHTLDARSTLLKNVRSSGATKGVSRYRLEPRSTVRKIDLVFGLPEGADISGTTSDSSFFMDYVNYFLEAIGELSAAAQNFGTLLYLLAPATMIPHGHHTLLETALSLTLCTFANYSIGFYSTLVPDAAPRNEAWARLNSIFLSAERDARNHRMLCYYDDQGLKAYVYGEGGENSRMELDAFRNAAQTGIGFLEKFRSFPFMPDKRTVDKYKEDFELP